jgi:hypothetical protein
MAICPKETIDSNVTGLRFAWERCLKKLSANPIWKVLEPNSYSDFGATITTTARNPINPSRSRKKGSVTDMDAQGGFNQDLTQNNLTELIQAFFFANARERGTTASLVFGDSPVSGVADTVNEYTFANLRAATMAVAVAGAGYKVGDLLTVAGAAVRAAVAYVSAVNGSGGVTAVAIDDAGLYAAFPASPAATTGGTGAGCTLTLTSGALTAFVAGQVVLASGFSSTANNGLKTVVSLTGGVLEVTEALVTEAAPPADAKLQAVGFDFDAGDVDLELNGGLVRLTTAIVDLTTLGIIPGEWIFLGGDAAASRFTNNYGFARASVVTEDYIEFDKVEWENPTAEAGAGKTIRVWFGTIIRNEPDPALILHKPVQLERTLGQDTDGTMSEYLTGATANEMTLNVTQAALCTVDLSFVACDHEPRTGLQGLKTGARPALLAEDAFNTTDHFARIKLSVIDPVSANPKPLFGHCTDITLSINNNVSPNKAVGTLGAFATTAGTFEVGGEMTAYFTSIDGPRAVRNNYDVTVDYILVKGNAGMLWDIPLLALGNGIVTVEQDQPVNLPLETNAAESKFGHTLLMQSFAYLPDIAGI